MAETQVQYLYDDTFLRMYYDESSSCIVKEWKSEVPSGKFRELIIQLLMQIIQVRQSHPNQTINLIADCSKLGSGAFTPENIAWLDKEVHPVYAMNKITRKAFIESSSPEANMSVIKYISTGNLGSKVAMNIFKNIDEAKKWIVS
jgi:hypothetical protein